VEEQVLDAVEFSRHSPQPDPARAFDHVWAEPINPPLPTPLRGESSAKVQTWLEAVRDGIAEEMRRDPHIIYLGEGTGERGGSFAHTKGLWHEFGGERMIDTPISELGFTGAAAGAAASGCRAVADLMFADFLFEAASQIVQQAGKLRYMSNGQWSVPLVVRASWGRVKSTGPHHSGSYHPVWAHCPGLLVVVPSTPADAKGLIKTALRASDPVLFLEPKALFATKGPVPEGEHLLPLGVARVVRSGSHLTVVSCGTPVHRCLEAAEVLAGQGVACEVIDLRTVVPLDVETIVASVAKTGRLLMVDEGFAMCGIGAEVATAVMEQAFDELDAPIGRLHTEPSASPFSPVLEAAVYVDVEKIIDAARAVLAGRPRIPRRARARVDGTSVSPAGQDQGDGHGRVDTRHQVVAPETTARDGVALIMPNQDLTITEATVLRWLCQEGDAVAKGQPVVEVETEKAVSQIEASADGTLAEILAQPGTVVLLGQRIGTIRPKL
jgi:2-oxoisovalerate dehydrogenase E1 component